MEVPLLTRREEKVFVAVMQRARTCLCDHQPTAPEDSAGGNLPNEEYKPEVLGEQVCIPSLLLPFQRLYAAL